MIDFHDAEGLDAVGVSSYGPTFASQEAPAAGRDEPCGASPGRRPAVRGPGRTVPMRP
jgi:hypothetical protein